MNSILTVINAAKSQDLTVLDSVKKEFGISGTLEDAKLAVWIKQASQMIANHCNRVFALETVRETFRFSPNAYIQAPASTSLILNRFPVAEIIAVTENDVALDVMDFVVDPWTGIVSRLSGDILVAWPRLKIVVDYTTGYELLTGLPYDVERACISLVRQIRSQSKRDPLAKRIEVPDVSTVEYWVGQIGQSGSMPPDVVDLLAPYMNLKV